MPGTYWSLEGLHYYLITNHQMEQASIADFVMISLPNASRQDLQTKKEAMQAVTRRCAAARLLQRPAARGEAGGDQGAEERLTGGLNIWSDAVFLTFGLFFADEAFHHFYDRSSFLLDHPADRRDHVQAKQTRSTTLRVE